MISVGFSQILTDRFFKKAKYDASYGQKSYIRGESLGKIDLKMIHSLKSLGNLVYINFQGEGECEINGTPVSFKQGYAFPDIGITLKRSIFEMMGSPNPFSITIEWDDQPGTGSRDD